MIFFSHRRNQKKDQLWKKYGQYFQEENFQEALSVIEALISLEMTNTEFFFEKCNTLIRLNRLEEAREILENLVDGNDKEAAERARLKIADIHMREENWNQALSFLPSSPPQGRTWEWLALYLRCCYELYLTDDFKQAAEKYWSEPEISVLGSEKEHMRVSDIYTLIGSLYEDELDLNDPDNARRVKSCFEKALALDPENEEAKFSLEALETEMPARTAAHADSSPSGAPMPAPLAVEPGELFAWTSAVLANFDRIGSPGFPFLLRLEMARLAACRAQPDRAAYILSSFDCPEPLRSVKESVVEWISRVSREEVNSEGAFAPIEGAAEENNGFTANEGEGDKQLLDALTGFDDEALFREVIAILKAGPEGGNGLAVALDHVFHGRLEKAHAGMEEGSHERMALGMALYFKRGDHIRGHRRAIRLLKDVYQLEPGSAWGLYSSGQDGLPDMVYGLDKSLFASADDLDNLGRIWAHLARRDDLPVLKSTACFVLHLLDRGNAQRSLHWESFLKASGLGDIFEQVKKDPFPYLTFFYPPEEEEEADQALLLREALSEVSNKNPDWEHVDRICRQLASEGKNQKAGILISFLQALAAHNLGRPVDTTYLDRLVPGWQKTKQATWNKLSIKPDNMGGHFEAAGCYVSALSFKWDYHVAWHNLGCELLRSGRYHESTGCFVLALAIKPDLHEAWNDLGVQLAEMDLHSEAAGCCVSALFIKPDKYKTWNNLGNRLFKIGLYSEAAGCFASALSIKWDYNGAWYNLGNWLGSTGRYPEAAGCLISAVAINPNLHEAWSSLGSALCYMGRYTEAVGCYVSKLAFKPDAHEAWKNLGNVLSNIREDEAALFCYKKVLILNISNQKAGRCLVNLCLRTGRWQEAETLGRFLNKLHGESLASDQVTALYYLINGEAEKALDWIMHMRERTGTIAKHGFPLVELDFLQGLVLFDLEKYQEAAKFLAAASKSDKFKYQCYPRLFMCCRFIDDRDWMDKARADWEKWLDGQIYLDDPSMFDDPFDIFDIYFKIIRDKARIDRKKLRGWTDFLRKHNHGNTETYNLVQDLRDKLEISSEKDWENTSEAMAYLKGRLTDLFLNRDEKLERKELVHIWHTEFITLREKYNLTNAVEERAEEIFNDLIEILGIIIYAYRRPDKPSQQYQGVTDKEVVDFLQIADNLLERDKDEKGAHFVTAIVTLCLAIEFCWKKYFISKWEERYKKEKGPVYFSIYHKLIGKSLSGDQDTELTQVESEMLQLLKAKDPHKKIMNKEYKETMQTICYRFRNDSMHINKSFSFEEVNECRKWVLEQLTSQSTASNNGLLPRFLQVFSQNPN